MRPFDWETAPLDDNILLEASAGTGKTYTLERLVLRYITERRLPLSALLVVTFTNQAAREMQERIRRLLILRSKEEEDETRRALLKEALTDFDSASILTIHGFCLRVLQGWPFECGVSPGLDVSGTDESTPRAVWDWFRRREGEELTAFEREAYRRAYENAGSFESLVSSLIQLVGSDVLRGGGLIIPEEDTRGEWDRLFSQWDSSATARGLTRLGETLSALSSDEEGVDQFKKEGLGKGLGAKTGPAFILGLKELARRETPGDVLDFLSGPGKGVEKRLRAVVLAGDLPTPEGDLAQGFVDLAVAMDSDFQGLSSTAVCLTLARLFELRAAREIGALVERDALARGELSFNGLIEEVHRLTGPGGRPGLVRALQAHYKVLLVDEFQDTDQRQWDIFSRLFSRKDQNFLLIGDPKQSIYRFRGADLQVYLQVRESLPESSRYRLTDNWRSQGGLVEAFNTLFPTFFKGGRGESIGYEPVGNGNLTVPGLTREGEETRPVEIVRLDAGEEAKGDAPFRIWAETCADIITDLIGNPAYRLGDELLTPSHMAALFETNDQCLHFQRLLSRRGIPALIYQESDVYRTHEGELITHFLGAMVNQDRGESLRKLLLSAPLSLAPMELLALEERGGFDRLVLTFRRFKEEIDRGDLVGQFSLFCRIGESIAPLVGKESGEERMGELSENLMERVLVSKDGLRTYTNLRHLLELLHREQQNRRFNAQELYRFVKEERYRSHPGEGEKIRLERDGQAVRIMTLHKSKGLQFPLVFFGGGFSGSLLKRNSSYLMFNRQGRRCYDFLRRDDNKRRAREEAWEEKKRLYYVALTRAESKLYMPLFIDWDKGWLSYFYETITGNGGEGDPFEKEGPNLTPGTAAAHTTAWLAGREILFDLVSPPEVKKERPRKAGQEPIKEPPFLSLDLEKRYPSLYSFSSLTGDALPHGVDLHGEDESSEADRDDENGDLWDEPALLSPEDMTPETLPGGASLGNVVHRILEQIDFSRGSLEYADFDGDRELDLLMEESSLYDFPRDWYSQNGSLLKKMIWNTLNAPLDDLAPAGWLPPRLSALDGKERLHEKEFLLGLDGPGKIDFRGKTRSLSRGYLKGFIDLVFRWNGRYFIADWKTTRPVPGEEVPYGRESMERIMEDHEYHLQYEIYTAAFWRFMALGDHSPFDYDHHFGGVLYFFNRAMDPLYPGRGVYYTRPDKQEILRFMEKLPGGSHV